MNALPTSLQKRDCYRDRIVHCLHRVTDEWDHYKNIPRHTLVTRGDIDIYPVLLSLFGIGRNAGTHST